MTLSPCSAGNIAAERRGATFQAVMLKSPAGKQMIRVFSHSRRDFL